MEIFSFFFCLHILLDSAALHLEYMKQNKRILSFLLAVCLIAGFLPAICVAAETDTQILGVEDIADGQYLYYGENKWLVLDADADNNGQAGVFLLSADVAESGIQFENSGLTNAWDGSDAKAWAEAYAAQTFTDDELSAIKAVTKTDAAGTYNGFTWEEGALTGEQVFFLSAEEVSTYLDADQLYYVLERLPNTTYLPAFSPHHCAGYVPNVLYIYQRAGNHTHAYDGGGVYADSYPSCVRLLP